MFDICHNIGAGLNSILPVLDEIYEKGEISTFDYKCVIRALQICVHRCNGKEHEAIRFLIDYRRKARVRCGCCLKRIPSAKAIDLSCLWCAEERIIDKLSEHYAYFQVSCPQCYEVLVKPLVEKDIKAGAFMNYRFIGSNRSKHKKKATRSNNS